MRFKLRFVPKRIPYWAARFATDRDRHIECGVGPRAKAAGYYCKEDFEAICAWKTPRTVRACCTNSPDYIRELTSIALSTRCEQLRIEAPTLLKGVGWPTASVLLHFGHREPYPILDYRALWSLGIDPVPAYDFDFWWGYVKFCRTIADQEGVSMRTLDRALWQFSKEHQPRRV